MNKLSCVVCDLDGSLLNSQKKIGAEDLRTVQKLKAKGVPVVVSTGRAAEFAKQVVSDIGFDYPVCACNGGMIYDYRTGKVLYAVEPIPAPVVREILAFLLEKGHPFMFYTTEGPLFESPEAKRTRFWMKQLEENFAPENAFPIRYYNDPDVRLDQMQVVKVLIPYVPDETKTEFEERFNREGTYEVVWSDASILDVNTRGTNKGSILHQLAKLYDFDVKDVLALGDNFNDSPMLEVAGYPVVPANGEEDLKAAACFITTDNDHDPLTHAVRELFPGLLDD